MKNLAPTRTLLLLACLVAQASAQLEARTPFQRAVQERYQITTRILSSAGEVMEIKPSFSADQVSWRASEVLIVDEGEVLDGRVVVTESLRGRIPVGTELDVPALAPYAEEEKRTTLGFLEDETVISGRTAVLFLMDGPLGKRVTDQGLAWVQSSGGGSRGVKRYEQEMAPLQISIGEDQVEFWPCDLFGTWTTSMAWLEGEKVYANTQPMNPGPSKVSTQEGGLTQLRNLVRTYDSVHAAAQRALAEEDPVRRARALAEGLHGGVDNHWLRVDLVAALVLCGQPAVAPLAPWLEDTRMAAGVSRALADIGGDEARRALEEALEAELAWWRDSELQAAPDQGQRARVLRERKDRATSLVENLRRLGRSGRGKGLLHELIERIEAHPELGVDQAERLRRSLAHL